ncbi:DUF1572 family protein [Planktosalinus lacus]|uniref:DUF1572 domain-containing protein n=1 Tax=Planktosalinus lacus TaxID=1526573 RepID=A0A8J2Y6Z5_9FLAO|nr:DUF1572 family protein [Planktosalinus lacus]GGD93894.1 hypothetical protein GCM10011312_17040 [Planktosalinus lacus]
MTHSEFLAARLEEVLLNGRWIANTNYQDQLKFIKRREALLQVDSLNSIAALTYHINYYLAGILNVFYGGNLEIKDANSFDMPPINSEEDWTGLKETLFANAQKFIKKVNSMTDHQLNAVFVEEKYGSYQHNIEGVVEHCYYHLGQIVLINKLLKVKRLQDQ